LRAGRFILEQWRSGRDDVSVRVVLIGAAIAAVAVLGQTVVHLANRAWIGDANLDADVEGNFLTWVNGGAVLACVCLVLALAALVRKHRLEGLLLAAALGVLALDDLAELHERGSLKVAALLEIDADFIRVLWPVLYLPMLAFILAALWQLGGRASEPAALGIRFGLVLLVAAVAVEVLWATWHLTVGKVGDWPDTIQVAIEEGLELGGWTLIASGLAAFLVTRLLASRDEAWVVGFSAGVRRSQPGSAVAVDDAPAEAQDRLANRRGQPVHKNARSVL
jgi:hypothetical protein